MKIHVPVPPQKPKAAESPLSKKKRERSPKYPYLSLRAALERVHTIWQHEKRNIVPIPVLASHWGYAAKSSGVFQTISALKQYGLTADEGIGDKRGLRLSESALAILREEPNSDGWIARIQTAALAPPIHRELWNRFKTEASDKNIKTYLIFDRKFAELGALALIKEYRDTIGFAQLSESDTVAESSESIGEDEGNNMNSSATLEPPPPPLKAPASGSVREFAVPLPSGAIAAFKIPFPMSEEDFKQYSSLLVAYKTAIVKKPEE